MKRFGNLLWGIFSIGTAIVGYEIHSSIFWSIMDFLFSPLAWAKWLVCHQISISVIKSAFSFFLK